MTSTPTVTFDNESLQVSITAAFVCVTKYNSNMFRVIDIPEKYRQNKHLNTKLKLYEDNQYIYINEKKVSTELDKTRKYKIYILFSEFTDKKGDYVLYISETLLKDKGELPERQFNSSINELSDSE